MAYTSAKVYIATTQGLVQIQSITALADADLASVVSVNNSSNIAGISRAYQHFVQQPQGIINALFGGDAYRLNLSHDINQGDSWQLGVYLAHYLFANGLFCSQQNLSYQWEQSGTDNAKSEMIFIATGQIDTVNQTVLSIEHLSKKCASAGAQIQQWQQQNINIIFLAPKDNLREPIAQTSMQLTPVYALAEIANLCNVLGFSSSEHHAVNRSLDDENVDTSSTNNFAETIIESSALLNDNLAQKPHNTEVLTIDALEVGNNQSYATLKESTNDFKNKKLRINLAIILVLGILFIWPTLHLIQKMMQPTANMSTVFIEQTPYLLNAQISENQSDCQNAEPLVLTTGTLAASSPVTSVNVNHLCQLHILTTLATKDLWLINSEKLLLPLRAVILHKDDDAELLYNAININQQHPFKPLQTWIEGVFDHYNELAVWAIPTPKTTSSKHANYSLIAFSKVTDAADLQSFKQHLEQISGLENHVTQLQLKLWFTNVMPEHNVSVLPYNLVDARAQAAKAL